MKFVLSMIAVFAVACIGWSLIGAGSVVAGVGVLVLCGLYAYYVSASLSFSSFRDYINYLQEVSDLCRMLLMR